MYLLRMASVHLVMYIGSSIQFIVYASIKSMREYNKSLPRRAQ